ncbi:MAG TPA: F0F1 ATP synthase subunit epsilon [Chromatiaceae bacterium]|jgi:F-type H+-transporting ATPase subunit epsilon|nr:F0F1 ATP synthase subunit epsilon [Chromatiaceae bacterium]HIA08273.1 F0F1 ATP synthase subunit epsilon [Chromatiaceae bacterium]HIB84745.1 F0F1 ATP synthase subunit epsilon [Chromatiaceae bacterium]HIN82209.1 F0F1 ATP synthase subunit epsilon [Chromatiales bacterium]HIO55196.1 F0F1 ATP synthase subunit epsilon [Chromatiales bacterium]
MAMTIHVDIVSAETEIYSGLAEMVYAPAEMGEVGIAPRHTPLITRLKPGEVRVETKPGIQEHFYVSGGILEVQPHVVTVLADTAIRAKDLDEAAALEAKEKAEQALLNQGEEFNAAKAQGELAEAMAQLRAIGRLKQMR